MGRTRGINPRVGAGNTIQGVLQNIKEEYLNALEVTLKLQCEEILANAVQFRETAPGAHNITGNLLNSILVFLFRKGKLIYEVSPYANLDVPFPIRTQMTSPRRYHFRQDYTGDEATYKPAVETNSREYGFNEARHWIRTHYKVSRKKLFEIVVVYGAEYSGWVEMQRATTGYAATLAYLQAKNWNFGEHPF